MHNIEDIISILTDWGWQTNVSKLQDYYLRKFRIENDWSKAAMKLSGPTYPASWKWKQIDPVVRQRCYIGLMSIISSFWLSREDKAAIAGWILSEILHEVP